MNNAAAQNTQTLQQAQQNALKDIRTGLTNATGAVNTGMTSLQGLGDKYGAATNMYLDALGVNGAQGTQNAQNAFTAGPGYQWMMDQALDAVNRTAGARGMLRSGNTMSDTVSRASGLAGQEYNNWLNNLSKGIAPETMAYGGQADLSKTLGGLYQNAGNAQAGIRMNTAGGIANQNSMAANAATQGSGNLWNMGLNLLNLGSGMAGYGGFGGGGGSPAGYNWNGTGFLV